ncbi:hypothetical protein OT109_01790 [Phycisphaeraceae bacterium D3-23]
MSTGRLIAALIVGFLVVQVAVMVTNGIGGLMFHSMPDPETKKISADANTPGMCAWNIAWYLPAGAIGAFVATKIARARPWWPVIGMAGLIVLIGVPYAIFAPPMYREFGADIPGWCLPLLPLTGTLGVLLGGWLGACCCRRGNDASAAE